MKKLALLAALLFPAIASAHAMLDHALPAVGSSVAQPPKEVRLSFDQPVGVDKSRIEVTDANGKLITTGALHGDEKDDTVLIIPVSAASGKVMVKWDAFCPPCGHTSHGSFTFTVGK